MDSAKNAMSIDLEDWFCVYNLSRVIRRDDWNKCELRVVKSTQRILQLLSIHNTQATFFVLGWIAERVPNLIREIEQHGHEIATHGYSHYLLSEMTPESFEEDLQKALKVTRACMSQEILGFRAPSFTISEKTSWALDILIRNGIRYDSSIFPIGFHPDYGTRDGRLSTHTLNGLLIEVPPSCAEVFGCRIPCAGGGYFRLFPYPLTKFLLKRCNSDGRPAIFYLHPWELDPDQPRVRLPWRSWPRELRHYYNLNKTATRLERLLTDFKFTSIREVLGL
jgi:polysaccharide deacetylase family protein (PEP-CTERM system associated)